MAHLPQLLPDKHACTSPHVVILGAGASLAAFPDGDKNGLRVPLMKDLVETVGLDDLLRANDIRFEGADFEALYDSLAKQSSASPLLHEMERSVFAYFSRLQLTDQVTLYDCMSLSLRAKDVIATFNWDPFLALTYQRHRRLRELPRILFLHGNVAVGVCLSDKRKGWLGDACDLCGNPLQTPKLLFPVAEKNYADDPFICNEWEDLSSALESAYLLTIFGYSAPATDAAAKSLMRKIWDSNQTRELAQIEIVNTAPEEDLKNAWEPFFVRDHYHITDHLEKTWMFRFPRRSCDSFAAATLLNAPWASRPLPDFQSLADLEAWVQPLIREEVALRAAGTPFKPFTRNA